jgi:hypothetical protein
MLYFSILLHCVLSTYTFPPFEKFIQGSSYICWPARDAALHGDRRTAGCDADTKFADESICLLADNFRNEVVTIHKSQVALKMLSLYKYTFLAPAEMVLIYPLKLFWSDICNFPTNIFF